MSTVSLPATWPIQPVDTEEEEDEERPRRVTLWGSDEDFSASSNSNGSERSEFTAKAVAWAQAFNVSVIIRSMEVFTNELLSQRIGKVFKNILGVKAPQRTEAQAATYSQP